MATLAICILLAACATDQGPAAVSTTVSGPRFAATQFDCGARPIPPNPAGAGGKTAAKYENRLGAWEQGCQDKLQSTDRELDAAGQVVR